MRKGKDNARLLTPFYLARSNKVVNQDSSSVGEVSKLCLPNDQCVRVGDRIPVLKAEHTIFAQMTIRNPHVVGHILQKGEFLDISFLIGDEGVPVREGPSLNILS